MPEDIGLWVALALSGAASLLCWVRVARSTDPSWFKVLLAAIAAIPFFGPIFFVFINHPPSLPETAMAKGEWTKGTTARAHITQDLSAGYRRYLNMLYGVGAPNPLGKRRDRRRKRGDA